MWYFLLATLAAPDLSAVSLAQANAHLPTYHWLHSHPELSLHEEKTAQFLASELRKLGVDEVHEHVGGYGIVAVLRGHAAGPVVLYRADMDALPVTEATGLPYASANAGVMHACGHDLHMTTALGTLAVLAERRKEWRGTVVFVGQPAEEIVVGAKAMLADAAFKEVIARVGKPVVSIGLHDSASLPTGVVGITPGYVTANADAIDIVLHGKGAHGSTPQAGVDAVLMGAELVTALQTIVSRRVPTGEKAVLTVGQFTAGTKRNILAEQATLSLTIRTYTPEIRKLVLDETAHLARSIAAAFHAPQPPDILTMVDSTDATYNDPAWSARLTKAVRRTLGDAAVVESPARMYSEDVGRFAEALGCPGVFIELGAAGPGEAVTLHSAHWAPQMPQALQVGIQTMSAVLLEALTASGA